MAEQVIQRIVILAEVEKGTIHPVALKKDEEAKILWCIEQVCEGGIKIREEPVQGVRFLDGEETKNQDADAN